MVAAEDGPRGLDERLTDAVLKDGVIEVLQCLEETLDDGEPGPFPSIPDFAKSIEAINIVDGTRKPFEEVVEIVEDPSDEDEPVNDRIEKSGPVKHDPELVSLARSIGNMVENLLELTDVIIEKSRR